MNHESSRRDFLKLGLGMAAGTMTLLGSVPKAFAAACGLTPAQTEGPFYPGESEFDGENDLTRVGRSVQPAKGERIYIRGIVQDADCRPIKGANVEIWQACASGRYNHPGDPNPAPLDPNFRYWGEAFTNEKGEYSFKTVLPGAYPADTDWIRPSHIHYKVNALGYRELTTQLYFKGDKYNAQDKILKAIPAAERSRVIVDFLPVQGGNGRVGQFDITLLKV